MRSERNRHRARPPDVGLVLEVGGGQAPHLRSDVVVDKYPLDDFERAGNAALSFAKPLIVADAEALPLAGGSFVYSIAQHVLEHAIDPARFGAELERVSRAGFVQVPSSDSELVYGWPYHPWLIDLTNGGMTFSPKEEIPPGGGVMHEAFSESPLLRLAWAAHRSRWHHSVHWQGRLPIEVRGDRVLHEQADSDVERTVSVLSRAVTSRPMDATIWSLLRCPACRMELRRSSARLECVGCARAYPIAGHVPVLLADAAL